MDYCSDALRQPLAQRDGEWGRPVIPFINAELFLSTEMLAKMGITAEIGSCVPAGGAPTHRLATSPADVADVTGFDRAKLLTSSERSATWLSCETPCGGGVGGERKSDTKETRQTQHAQTHREKPMMWEKFMERMSNTLTLKCLHIYMHQKTHKENALEYFVYIRKRLIILPEGELKQFFPLIPVVSSGFGEKPLFWKFIF